ncbi:Orotate phosphoribosyltransferase [bacterium HR34]|nr:Orotate phosphoribosyltransferase [bacterium HR34]
MQLIKQVLEYIFPYYCLICKKDLEKEWICDDCFSLIEILERQYCPHCNKVTIDGMKCKKSVKSYINNLYCATSYQNKIVKELIHNFKYAPFCKELSKTLVKLIYYHLLNLNKLNLFLNNKSLGITYIPLHKRKLKLRGFNQSELLAKELADLLKIDFLNEVIIKVKDTQSQTTLKKEERKVNVRDSFKINKKPIKKQIIIVDDVYTTGATMQEAAKVLKENGVKKVIAMVIARE